MKTALAVLLFTLIISRHIYAQDLDIIHIDIGQGDATLILGPPDRDGKRISVLMDAGDIPMQGDPDGGRIVGAVLNKYGIKQLDWFIASHYDADHIGGIIAGNAQYHGNSFVFGQDSVPGSEGDDDGDDKVDWLDTKMIFPDPEEIGKGDDIKILNFVDRGDSPPATSTTYKKYKAIANSMGKRYSVSTKSEVNNFAPIDLGNNAQMTLLAANGYVKGRGSRVDNVDTENERSLCFLVSFGDFDYLIGGDMIGQEYGREDAEVEIAVGQHIEENDISIEALHVGHHGANNASEAQFLDLIHPQIAIISLGDGNDHGHPNINALERLARSSVYRIYQTNWGSTKGEIPSYIRKKQAIFQGDIILSSDGETYTVSTSRTFAIEDF